MTQDSLQLRVFRFGLFQHGDVGIRVFPESEEILISSLSFRGIAGKDEGTAKTQVCQSADRFISDDSRMIENCLELARGGDTVPGRQVSLAAKINGIERKGEVLVRVSQFISRS